MGGGANPTVPVLPARFGATYIPAVPVLPTNPTAVTGPSVTGPAFYVAPSGDDANPGTEEAPWRSLQHAFDATPAGGIAYMRGGTYQGASLTRSGVAVASYAGETAVVNGTVEIRGVIAAMIHGLVAQSATETFRAGFHIVDSQGVTLTSNVARGNSLGIFLENTTASALVGNTMTGNAYGLEVHGRTDGTTVSGNTITQNNGYLDPGRSAGGVNFYRTSGGITFAGNTVSHNREVALEIYGASDLLISGNVLTGSNDLIETGTESGWSCNNLRVIHNLGYNSGTTEPHESGFYLRCASNSLVAHNTLVGLDRFAFGLMSGGPFGGSIENLRIVNNIAAYGRPYSLDSCLPNSVTIDYNLTQPTAGPLNGDAVAWVACQSTQAHSIEELRAMTGYDVNGALADPRFVNVAAGDYGLGADSPAIDAALTLSGINDGYVGSAPDTGRWER